MATKSKKSTKKIEYDQQEREVIAFCWVGHGQYTWSIGYEPNIIHATRAVRKAKRDFSLKGWQVIPVSIFDIEDTEHWAFDGGSIVDADKQDKESKAYKEGDIYNPYRGCPCLKKIAELEVVS
ncbi:MAG: hypothetical protein CBD21_00305 [bacterium TMED161]|nr:MAG: hypothetical protein CBD21_00305 [bacterium TMED161]|tara:strand:- start:415 stop:783 length:369 start_codon:yes stop_codon:yes gene_type:complete